MVDKRILLKKCIALTLIISLFAMPAFADWKELKSEKLQKISPKLECTTVCDYRLDSININWWDNYSDPYIKEYIYKAISKNHDLKKAALRSEEYRQMVKVSFASELPTLALAPAFLRVKTAGGNQLEDVQFSTTRTNIYNIPLFAFYEADVFLKNHDKTKSAKQQQEAVEYEEKAAYISMATDVAALYVNIVKTDKLIKTQQKIVDVRKKIHDLTKDRNLAGLASTYDVTNTDKLHTIAQIELYDLLKQREIYLHQLAVYLDECPSDVEGFKRGKFDELEYKSKLPECISSEVVIMRPDLLKAEADLKRAKIDVRVARKEFLPMIPIFGSVGYNSLLLKSLFDWENIVAFVGTAAIQKLYTGGKLTANLRVKKIQYEELFENYMQANLIAIQEINDSMAMIKYDTKKDNDNLKKLKLEASNFSLINERYKAGIMSYLQMIQYQENLLTLQSEKDNSKAQRLIDYMTLYKATGTRL